MVALTTRHSPGTRHISHVRIELIGPEAACTSFPNAGGYYTDASLGQRAFVVTQKNGIWGMAEQVPGLGGAEAVAETYRAIQDVGRWWP